MSRILYEKVRDDWKNDPDLSTPIMAEDLEHIEQGIYDNSDRMALKEIYGDRSIRLSEGNEDPTRSDIMSIEVGYKAKANAPNSVAIGNQVETSASNSFSTGLGTKASGVEQFVGGRYNEEADGNTVFILGGGTSDIDRKNIHTVDYKGNAYFAGDVSNNQYSLNAIGSTAGTVDVTKESTISASEQMLEITVPLNTVMNAYGNYTVGGDFIGFVMSNMPPMLFNLQISAIRNGEVSGKAVLINTVPASAAVYGYKFEGEIGILFSSPTDPKAKVAFELGRSATVQNFTIYRTAGSAVDFSIAQLRADIQSSTITADDIPSYDDVLLLLNESEEEVEP